MLKPKRPMTPLTLSAYRLVTANACRRIDEFVVVCRDCCCERGLCNA